MRATFAHFGDQELLRTLASLVSNDRRTTANLVACIAEVDERRLYVPAGYPSMFEYCLRELHLSEDMAWKRIRAARASRDFPAILGALADGRLHLTGVVMLAPHLTAETADELLTVATHKTKAEIERLIVERSPRPDVPSRVRAIAHVAVDSPAPERVTSDLAPDNSPALERVAPGLALDNSPAPERIAPGMAPVNQPRPKVVPLAPERFAVQFTIDKATHDKLRHAQALLSHQMPSGDLPQVFDRALKALIRELERRKFAASAKPRPRGRRPSANPRHIPAHVRRAVWQRDQGRCTFMSEDGHRCSARKFLEYDHLDPVARGGEATIDAVRLRCRAHNQYEADCVFGAGFMNAKRERARLAAAETRVRGAEVRAGARAGPG